MAEDKHTAVPAERCCHLSPRHTVFVWFSVELVRIFFLHLKEHRIITQLSKDRVGGDSLFLSLQFKIQLLEEITVAFLRFPPKSNLKIIVC